ncbi:MAG: SAM-dependent chlorinase/fluorinase [Planctomycetia bacterium]|nr:SAM-dependent chlorinase/fluorinase [Planctomycetia bacterium]
MEIPFVTLLTDFQEGSSYIAEMKGMIYSACPNARVIDLTHSIEPQNIEHASIILRNTAVRFPLGTLHVAVVDPGVGSQRRLIYAEAGSHRFLLPDNGILSDFCDAFPLERAFVLQKPFLATLQTNGSHTFHGRDILAPAAGFLLNGGQPEAFGEPTERLVTISRPVATRQGERLCGRIVYADSFGNLITNIRESDLPPEEERRARLKISASGVEIQGVRRTYSAGGVGDFIALVGSSGFLEIAVVNGNAARALQKRRASPTCAAVSTWICTVDEEKQ